MEGVIRQRTVKSRCVIRSLVRIIRGCNVTMEVQRCLRNKYSANTDVWIKDLVMEYGTALKSAYCGNGYLRGVCGLTRRKDESVYKRGGMKTCANGVM